MTVMWTTLEKTPHPTVLYGTDMDNLNLTRNGTTSTYTQAGWKGYVGWGCFKKKSLGGRHWHRERRPLWASVPRAFDTPCICRSPFKLCTQHCVVDPVAQPPSPSPSAAAYRHHARPQAKHALLLPRRRPDGRPGLLDAPRLVAAAVSQLCHAVRCDRLVLSFFFFFFF